jgi:hypothetical protein
LRRNSAKLGRLLLVRGRAFWQKKQAHCDEDEVVVREGALRTRRSALFMAAVVAI